MSSPILQSLNAQQRAAVEYMDGPSLVIAGAGSGKTRVLTYKIALLIEQGMKPWQILALTFTNKAANEMKERIGTLVGEDKARYLHMGTFHSVFARMLRREADALGYGSNYTIYDEADSRSLLKTIVRELGLDDKAYNASTINARLSLCKNRLILPEQYAASSGLTEQDRQAKRPRTAEIYAIYQQRLRGANAMDFDDLLVNTWMLFEQYPDLRRTYAEQYRFVLVDEYQDTNYVQQLIVLQLTQERQRVCVVGDDAQSIYAFRGANIDNILDFQNSYPDTKIFKLERNYRSSQTIVQAAGSLIEHNQRQIRKQVYSKEDKGEKIRVFKADTDRAEAAYVCSQIERMSRRQGGEGNAFAILYRTHAQSRQFEEQLINRGISYHVYGGLGFYQHKEIKDIMAYLRLIYNHHDDEAFRRIVNYPARGIGKTTLERVTALANQNHTSLWTAISEQYIDHLPVNGGIQRKLEQFRALILSLAESVATADVYELGMEVIRSSGIHDELRSDNSIEGLSRQDNMREMVSSMKEFVDTRRKEARPEEVFLSDFLQEASLRTDLDADNGAAEATVTLMTVHSAKGLEFETVFVAGLEENIFPSQRSLLSLRELEEERRLLYVAITRAKRHCYLTYCQMRYRFGQAEYNRPSRFLSDIDSQWLQKSADLPLSSIITPSPKPYRAHLRPLRMQEDSEGRGKDSGKEPYLAGTGEYQAGTIVRHATFGRGTVLHSEGYGSDVKIRIRFDTAGEKTLLAKYARLNVVGSSDDK